MFERHATDDVGQAERDASPLDSLPAGLRREHRTKAGVWALIHVVEGQLRYRIFEPRSEQILTAAAPGVVSPEQPHEVEPVGPMRMFVEYWNTSLMPQSGVA